MANSSSLIFKPNAGRVSPTPRNNKACNTTLQLYFSEDAGETYSTQSLTEELASELNGRSKMNIGNTDTKKPSSPQQPTAEDLQVEGASLSLTDLPLSHAGRPNAGKTEVTETAEELPDGEISGTINKGRRRLCVGDIDTCYWLPVVAFVLILIGCITYGVVWFLQLGALTDNDNEQAPMNVQETIDYLKRRGVSTQTDMTITGSPQFQAVQWLAEKDKPLRPNEMIKEERLTFLSRYVLAVVYFSFNMAGNLTNDRQFLSARHVCDWHTDDSESGFFCDDKTGLPISLQLGAFCSFPHRRRLIVQ